MKLLMKFDMIFIKYNPLWGSRGVAQIPREEIIIYSYIIFCLLKYTYCFVLISFLLIDLRNMNYVHFHPFSPFCASKYLAQPYVGLTIITKVILYAIDPPALPLHHQPVGVPEAVALTAAWQDRPASTVVGPTPFFVYE